MNPYHDARGRFTSSGAQGSGRHTRRVRVKKGPKLKSLPFNNWRSKNRSKLLSRVRKHGLPLFF